MTHEIDSGPTRALDFDPALRCEIRWTTDPDVRHFGDGERQCDPGLAVGFAIFRGQNGLGGSLLCGECLSRVVKQGLLIEWRSL